MAIQTRETSARRGGPSESGDAEERGSTPPLLTEMLGAIGVLTLLALPGLPYGPDANPPARVAGTTGVAARSATTACGPTARSAVDSTYAGWTDLVAGRDSLPPAAFTARADSIVERSFALQRAARQILGDRWEELDAHRQTETIGALRRAIRREALAALAGGEGRPPRLTFDGREEADGADRLRYRVEGAGTSLVFHLARTADGACAIHDVAIGGDGHLKAYRERARKLLNDYSFPYMIAEIAGDSVVVLEDFESSPEGELPEAWGWKDADDDKNKPYRIRVEDGNRYLEATDEGESVILGKEIKWNLEKYPYVSFRVRVHRIPEGGDERYDDTVDSAAGLYFTYRRKLFGKIPESVKYVWSSTLPVGAAAIRDGIGRPWQVVFGSGREELGEWRTYTFDLRDAYRKTFGGNPPSKPIGIGILSDANSTNSVAYADYDHIVALESAPPGVDGGVDEIVTP